MKRINAESEDVNSKKAKVAAELKYITGFGGEHASEALPNALPKGQNTPQKCAYGLFAEQQSGTSFTTPRANNQRTWLYRIRPTVGHPSFKPLANANPNFHSQFTAGHVITPDQLRWKPYPLPEASKPTDFVEGLNTVAGSGSPDLKVGMAIHVYCCNRSMGDKAFVNADGDFLIVPQQGTIFVRTEYGNMEVPAGFICVIQRGNAFSVDVDGESRGYIAEVYNGHFKLPDLGPIGANGLANPRDFEYPTACYEDRECKFTVVHKFMGQMFYYEREHSIYDVVAWHGNYVPYRYNLADFVVVNSTSIDHLDPSIFTVLTCATAEPGVACCDFVIFPPRWAVQERTFRPPYYHRNCMSEFMGNIMGRYEAKPDGFMPGGGSLHSCMTAHGPDSATFDKASNCELKPTYLPGDSLAFMFESTYMFRVTDWAMNHCILDDKYHECWQDLHRKKYFQPPTSSSSSSSE